MLLVGTLKRFLLGGILLVVLAVFLLLFKRQLMSVDSVYFHESLRDEIGMLISNDDWASAMPLPRSTDRSWLESKGQASIYRIAHALGPSNAKFENTYAAFEQSSAAGFLLFEVDISLDEAGRLRCHHGPGAMSKFVSGESCTLDGLFERIRNRPGWFVLDIKTDFAETADRIVALARKKSMQSHLIFQLYGAKDLQWFSKTASDIFLPVPIVTTYSSRRSANHILGQLDRLNVEIAVVPNERLASIRPNMTKAILFTHPVHNCTDWGLVVNQSRISGIYTVTGFDVSSCM